MTEDSQSELLFFDTFSHDSAEDLNLDLVQFPRAVLVNEVRVIPLGTRVQADVPGGVRLGATNPSTFKLEFFSNNLSKRDSSTFEKLGLLEYNANVDIQFLPENKNPTDGLIIKGWYTTITLAVYGALTTVVARDKSPPPPPPPQPRTKAVVDAVSSSSAQPPAKPSSSLTPSDLPSLPSSKKVHKWLVDSTRPSGAHSTHPHVPQPAPHRQPPHWTQPEEPPQAIEDPALHPNQVVTVPVSNLNQADLAREIFQVLGTVAAQTIEQSKLLSQSQPAPVHQAGVNISTGLGQYQTTQTFQYTEGQDTPASPGPGGPVDFGTYGPRGTVPIAVSDDNLQTAIPQDFSRPPQPVPQHAQALGEVTPAPWAGQPQDFPPPEQQPIPIVGSIVSQPPQGHHGDLVATPEDEAMLLDIDPNYQSQASRSPRDIPLEQNTGTIDPRLDPRELPRDPRDRLPDTKDAPDASKHRKDRGGSRSRSRSRDRDYDRRSRERDYRDSRDYRDEHRDREYREHRERDRPSDSRDWQSWEQGRDSRDWERDRDRERTDRLSRESERDRDRDRGREPDRERDRNWGGDAEWDRREDRDRGRDDRDRDRSRDQDKGSRDRDKEKSREFDRSRDQERDRERPRDTDRDRDRNRDLERSRDTDRERKDSDRERTTSKREDDRERTKELETDRDRTRDSDRSRERDRDWGDKQRKDKDGDKDRERSKDPVRDVPRDPMRDVRDPSRDSSREITRDTERHWEQEPKDKVVIRDKPPQPLVPPQLEEIRTSEPIPVIMSPVPARTRSPTPEMNPQYQQVDMIGMSPETPMGEIPPDAELENPDGVDIYGSLSVDNLNENLSDGEIQEAEGYSDISSDDNILTHLEEVEKIGDWGEYEIDDAWNFAISAFNPYQCYLGTLETFSDPSLTPYEVQKQKLVLARPKLEEQIMPSEAQRILSIVAQYKSAQHHESWIEAAEEIPPLLANGLSYLVNKTDNKVLDTLLDWAFEGLDLNLAMAQPETAYKVRHLKMGIRLATALCSCDSYITFRMLSREVQHKLLDLFVSQYMSSSIKVQIVKGLDASTRLKDGMDWLLGKHHLQAHTHASIDAPGSNENKTGYQRLLEIMLTKQVVRVTVALASLARKTHIYEILGKLNSTVKAIADSTPVPEVKPIDGTADSEVPIESMESDPPLAVENVTDEDAEIVVGCLEEASKVLRNVDNLLAQSKRGLPNELLFTKQEKCDSSSSTYHLLSSCHILESIFVLLSSPSTCNHNGIFHAVRGLLQQFLSSQTGLVFLSSRAEDVANGIIRCLLQNPATAGGEYSQDEDRENHPAHQLGLTMIYSLQALQHIDQLKVYHGRDGTLKDVDDAEALGALHALYTMTFVPQGREAIVFVLALDDNMDIFMPFLEAAMAEGLKDGRKKSVCYSYTIMFLLMMLRYSDQISWMQKLGPRIMDCCENADVGSSKMAEKLAEIQEMLLPIRKCPEVDHNKVTELIALLKLYNEDILDLPKGIVTVLRLLKHLSTAPSQDPSCQEHVSELKYKYVILELFSSDSLPIFCNILQKVGDLVLGPWQQGFPQNSTSKTLILSIVRPILTIMKSVLCDLIQTRGSQFKDLSCLPCLLHLHTVLCSWSHTGTLTGTLQQLQDDIVDIILCYTQPTVDGQDSDQALSQSLWTLTMKEIFKYVLMAPYTFLSGLILISELLPLPLPVQAKEALSPEEVDTITNNRKLWSAHLHPLAGEIQEVIRSLSPSVCHPLQQVLRRVCWQLADLAVPSAVTVVRCLLDVLIENLDISKEKEAPQPTDGDQKDTVSRDEVKSSSEMARVLNLLSFLMNQAPFKAAFLSMTRPGPKAETKYADILPRLLSLVNVVSESPSHTLAQENIVSVLQSLCDCDVSLVTAENVTLADQLPSSLPSPEQLNLICMGLMHHMSHPDQKFSSILPSLRTLAMLMDHDFGFYHVKCAMERVGTAFFNLFNQINITFSKDSSDCLATLSSAAECIQFLVTLPETSADAAELAPLERSYTMSLGEVRELLGWSDAHPLEDLNALLCEYAKEEETLRAVYESVNGVVTMLKSEEDDTQRQRPEVVEPQLSAPEPLVNQFAMRTTFTLTDDEDDRLSATYWLATPMIDDQEMDLDLSPCDFDEMSLQYCPDFDLKIELEKGSLPSDITATKPRKRRRGNDTINTSRMRGSGGGFVAPMRGRGFGRGMNMNLNKNDAFRSRAPNTSRPPSMHVDDFVKFENSQGHSQNHSPSNQQQSTNLRIQRQDKDNNMGARGRGFDRGRGGGRGFFQGHFQRSGGLQSNNYNNRREQNQRGGFGFRGGPIGGNRGGLAQRGTGSVRGSATSRGGSNINNRGSPIKSTSPWRTPRQQGYSSRGFGRGDSRAGSTDRMGSADRVDRRRDNLGGSSRFQRNGRQLGGSPWENKSKGERFMPPPGGFHRRDRGRHQRAFTK